MSQKNKRTQKAQPAEKVATVKPIFKVEPKNVVPNTPLNPDEQLKVDAFYALDGMVVDGGTVDEIIKAQLQCDAHPEATTQGYSVRIGQKHRIVYRLNVQNGQTTGDPRQFFLVIRSIGDPPYTH
jgi:hypothetical protein